MASVSEKDYESKRDFLQKLMENYDNIRQINSGGGGIIYAGFHRRLKQPVILKKIRLEKINVIGKEREMQVLMSLKHTYLPRILDFWSYEDEVYTVMEYIEGKSFQEYLNEGRRFTQAEVIRWTRQLAEVLDYLHTSKEHIIHSDVKPANLMLTPQNNICLIDFNVSLLQGSEGDETIGYTPAYSPVEQLIYVEEKKRLRRQAGIIQGEYGDGTTRQDEDAAQPAGEDTLLDEVTELADEDVTQVDDDVIQVDEDVTQVDEDITQTESERKNGSAGTVSPSGSGKQTLQTAAPVSIMAQKSIELQKKYGTGLAIDDRSDIYSACATMYHILTGRKPAPCYERQIPVENLLPTVNDAFAHILMHGMEQDPKKRFQTAGQLLNAVKQIVTSTKRYKRMRLRQDVTLLLLLLLFCLSSAAAYVGFGMKAKEEFGADLNTAYDYYRKGSYREAIDWLDEEILSNHLYQEDIRLSQGYYLKGGCYLQQEEYEKAVSEYRNAILLDSAQPDYYRDYGIALARLGDLESAQECLLQAQAKGLSDDSMLLLQGEIAVLLQEYEKAAELLQKCLTVSEDQAVKMRAYLRLDEVMQQIKGEEAYPDRITLLENACQELPAGQKLLVQERLIQVYGDYGQLTGDRAYTEAAVGLLDELIDSGYATLPEWLNKAVFLQSMGRFDESQSCLLEAAEKYPENYLIYKRLAFLELDRQSALAAEQRDYGRFQEYFTRCDDWYQQEGPDREQDLEMEYLYQVYDEVAVKGWFEE